MKAIFTLTTGRSLLFGPSLFPATMAIPNFCAHQRARIYTVRIDDQVITNDAGKFRFFDLSPGVKEVYVQRNGMNFFRSTVSIYNNSLCTVAEFRGMKGLVILQQVSLMQNN